MRIGALTANAPRSCCAARRGAGVPWWRSCEILDEELKLRGIARRVLGTRALIGGYKGWAGARHVGIGDIDGFAARCRAASPASMYPADGTAAPLLLFV